MITLKYLVSNMCKSSVVVGNTCASAYRIGSNPCRRIHLFLPQRHLVFPQWTKQNSAFSEQCNHIVETMQIGIRAVAEYRLALDISHPKMSGSILGLRKGTFFSQMDSGSSKSTSFFPALYDSVFHFITPHCIFHGK